MKRVLRRCADAVLSPLGYEVRAKDGQTVDEKSEGFPGYVKQALQSGMDVNDYEETILGWEASLPILELTTFPFLGGNSIVCEIGPGTGRWSRHVATRLPEGELHLVDHSPWLVDFLRDYFRSNPRIRIHLSDGYALPFPTPASLDLVFSMGTFIAMKLGLYYIYSREVFRVLKPGGHCIVEYIDVTRPEGWRWLETQSVVREYADCYTYHTPQVVERVFSSAGLRIMASHHIGRGTYLVMRKPEVCRQA